MARKNLVRAQEAIERRLVVLYTGSDGESGSALEVLLGATSLEDLLNRLETAERVSNQDAHVLGQVETFRGEIESRARKLARARREQADVVAERAAYRRQVEARLVERQQLLSSIQSEIARLEAAERARQRELERQARARLAAQQQIADQRAEAEQTADAEVQAASTETENAVASTAEEVGLAAETPAAAVAPPAQYGGVVGVAMQYLGTPYQWGGASPGGFDCSGFIMYVFSQIGVSLPHNAAAQYGYGTPVSSDQLAPGDLVFFDGLGHAGIYIGGGQFIHSPHTGDVVKITSMADSWYASTYVGARRL